MASLVPFDLWGSLRQMDPTRRFVSLAGIVAVAVLAWAIVQWATAPNFVPLFEQPLGLGEAGAGTPGEVALPDVEVVPLPRLYIQ